MLNNFLVRFHRQLAVVAVVLLPFMSITGGLWTLLKRHFDASKDDVKWLITWHQGDIFSLDPSGVYIKAPFCILGGFLCSIVIFSGIKLISIKSLFYNRNKYRRCHQFLGIISCLPLVLTVLSGSLWALCRYWLGYDKTDIRWLLRLHQGWFDCFIAYYPLFLACSTLALAIVGSNLISIDRNLGSAINNKIY
jgi:hypothetical protein